MRKQFYYQRDGEKVGPFNEAQFNDLQLPPDTLIWCYGMEDWMPYKDYVFQNHINNTKKKKLSLNIKLPKFRFSHFDTRKVRRVSLTIFSIIIVLGIIFLIGRYPLLGGFIEKRVNAKTPKPLTTPSLKVGRDDYIIPINGKVKKVIEYQYLVEDEYGVQKKRLGGKTIYSYDESGYLMEFTDFDDFFFPDKCAYVYDSCGNMISKTLYEDLYGIFSYKEVYKYGRKNELLSETEYFRGEDGFETKTSYVYDDKMNVLKKEFKGKGENRWSIYNFSYEYNEIGQMILKRENYFYPNGSYNVYLKYFYDNDGRLKKVFDGEGVDELYEYFANGKLKKKMDYGDKCIVEYDSIGNLLHDWRYKDHELKDLGEKQDYFYDENNNIITLIIYWSWENYVDINTVWKIIEFEYEFWE